MSDSAHPDPTSPPTPPSKRSPTKRDSRGLGREHTPEDSRRRYGAMLRTVHHHTPTPTAGLKAGMSVRELRLIRCSSDRTDPDTLERFDARLRATVQNDHTVRWRDEADREYVTLKRTGDVQRVIRYALTLDDRDRTQAITATMNRALRDIDEQDLPSPDVSPEHSRGEYRPDTA